jgi:hypothetical protein
METLLLTLEKTQSKRLGINRKDRYTGPPCKECSACWYGWGHNTEFHWYKLARKRVYYKWFYPKFDFDDPIAMGSYRRWIEHNIAQGDDFLSYTIQIGKPLIPTDKTQWFEGNTPPNGDKIEYIELKKSPVVIPGDCDNSTNYNGYSEVAFGMLCGWSDVFRETFGPGYTEFLMIPVTKELLEKFKSNLALIEVQPAFGKDNWAAVAAHLTWLVTWMELVLVSIETPYIFFG